MSFDFTKQEILDWIDFLYKDLLNHRVYVGGFYFKFDQLNGFKKKLSVIENEIRQTNEKFNKNIDYSIKNVCTSIPERPLELTEKNVLKLYDLEKFSKEVKSSLDVINNKLQNIEDNALAKKWQSLVERLVECSKKAFDYVGKNIYMQ